jgi:hypothetical protein
VREGKELLFLLGRWRLRLRRGEQEEGGRKVSCCRRGLVCEERKELCFSPSRSARLLPVEPLQRLELLSSLPRPFRSITRKKEGKGSARIRPSFTTVDARTARRGRRTARRFLTLIPSPPRRSTRGTPRKDRLFPLPLRPRHSYPPQQVLNLVVPTRGARPQARPRVRSVEPCERRRAGGGGRSGEGGSGSDRVGDGSASRGFSFFPSGFEGGETGALLLNLCSSSFGHCSEQRMSGMRERNGRRRDEGRRGGGRRWRRTG